MRSLLFPLLTLITCVTALAQNVIPNANARRFEINDRGDRIEFIKTDTALTTKKPVLLFLQGSLPKPLILTFPNGAAQVINFNFDVAELARHYHVVTIAMPHTPAVAPLDAVTEQALWVPDKTNPNAFSADYTRANFLENYVRRADAVIDWLRQQPWVDQSRLVVFGHSQGARIALRLAATNRHVTHLGFCGGSVKPRVEQFVQRYREDENAGRISAEEAQAAIENQYAWWAAVNQTPDLADSPDGGDSPKSVLSFSRDQTEEMLGLRIPVYIVYGSRDLAARSNDLLRLEAIRRGKTNLTFKVYPGREHNFAEVDENGRAKWETMAWAEVMAGFARWIGQELPASRYGQD